MNKKFFITAGGISILVLILILLLAPSKTTPTTSANPVASTSPISQLRASLTNLGEEKRTAAIRYYDLVSDNFPFFFNSFQTSSGIETTIHIFHFPDDPQEVTRFEIMGLSYINKNELEEATQPNVVAFKESFQKGLQLLLEAGIDPKQLIFVYGDVDYVQATASYWVDKLGLLR